MNHHTDILRCGTVFASKNLFPTYFWGLFNFAIILYIEANQCMVSRLKKKQKKRS